MRRAFADNAEFESTDDRRSKRTDIILSDARRGMSYKVSAFTKMESEQPLFYDLLSRYQSTISRNMHFFPIVCTPSTYTFISPPSPRCLLTGRGSPLFVSTRSYTYPTQHPPFVIGLDEFEEKGETCGSL